VSRYKDQRPSRYKDQLAKETRTSLYRSNNARDLNQIVMSASPFTSIISLT